MDNALTLKDLMKYPNAKIKFCENTGNLMSVNFRSDVVRVDWGHHKPLLEIHKCQLILRPSSSLTDQEKEVAENFFNGICDLSLTQSEFEEEVSRSWKDNHDYLRSLNIDIDHLQEKGLAIYV